MRYIHSIKLNIQKEAKRCWTQTISKSNKLQKLSKHKSGQRKRRVKSGDMNVMRGGNFNQLMPSQAKTEMLLIINFMEDFGDELESFSETCFCVP